VAAHRLRDPVHGLLLEVYHRDWRYYPAVVRDRVQVGHVLKGARALLEASSATGDETFAAAAFALADAALRHGWDPDHGGFCYLISRTGRVADSTKLWWHQCEALASLAHLAAIADSAKGGRYKAAYHTVAACVHTALWLERWPLPAST
jgi:mannose/cellobiose epimerase-like protein (N-acyl-D-glucosamine 2-epimerase family)